MLKRQKIEEYSEDLKIIISEAMQDIRKIERKIADVKKEYD